MTNLYPTADTNWTTVDMWETHEGMVYAYNMDGAEVIEIEALLNRDECLKWNEPYRPGRAWSVNHADGTSTYGHSITLTSAKKDAIAALNR